MQLQILLLIRICSSCKIAKIFRKIPNPLIKNAISENVSYSVSDHLPQFLLVPEFFSNSTPTKHNIMSYDWEKFNEEFFLEDYRNID